MIAMNYHIRSCRIVDWAAYDNGRALLECILTREGELYEHNIAEVIGHRKRTSSGLFTRPREMQRFARGGGSAGVNVNAPVRGTRRNSMKSLDL